MKYIKSFAALAAVIAITFSACQTPAQKAEAERLVSESVSNSERLVSESVSESERIVSESVSASESSVLEVEEKKQKLEDNITFREWFNDVKIEKNKGEHLGDLVIYLETSYYCQLIAEELTAVKLFIGDKEYSEFRVATEYDDYGRAKSILLGFDTGDATDYDSIEITIKHDNYKYDTVTYYPKA
jgi:hypothetical protein